jgi:hypothetical protein
VLALDAELKVIWQNGWNSRKSLEKLPQLPGWRFRCLEQHSNFQVSLLSAPRMSVIET